MAFTQYELSRQFWDFTFENPEKVKPTHIAIYFFAMEHCNRLGWKDKFGLPTSMSLEAIGLKSYNTYKNHFDELVAWGVVKVIEYSRNQYSSNIISLQVAISKNNKALDRATVKRSIKKSESTGESTIQSTGESTGESTRSIDKPITNNHKPITTTTEQQLPTMEDFFEIDELELHTNLIQYKNSFLKDQFAFGMICQKGIDRNKVAGWIDAFNRRLIFTADTFKNEQDWRRHLSSWITKIPNYLTMEPEDYNPVQDTQPIPQTSTPQKIDKFQQILNQKNGNRA